MSLLKIQLFLILSSQAGLSDKVTSFMEILQIEPEKIQRKTAEDVFYTLFDMCSIGLVDALKETGYFSKELIATKDFPKVIKSAKN